MQHGDRNRHTPLRLANAQWVLLLRHRDFTEACRLMGHAEAVSKIDHCYWMTQESAPGIFRHAGLEIVSVNLSRRQPQMGFLVRRSEPSPWLPVDPFWTKLQLRAFQHGASEWQEWGRSASDSSDWLRRKSIQAETRVYPQPLIP